MGDLVPSGKKFDRETLERIIRRASELQASQQDVGDDLTEDQIMDLGREVGLPTRYVQQAILEERTQAITQADNTLMARWMGPKKLSAHRTVPGNHEDVKKLLAFWMENEELLTVKRRFKSSTSWEAKRGFFVAVRKMGGQRFALSRTREVVGEVTQLESGWSHVRLEADLSNSRAEYLGGAVAMAASGTFVGGVAFMTGLIAPAIFLPPLLGAGLGIVVGRTRTNAVERVKVSLEQVLDRLEHGEIKLNQRDVPAAAQITRAIGEEVRKHFKGFGPKKGS